MKTEFTKMRSLLILVLVLFCSCSKYFDDQSKSIVSQEDAFSSTSNAASAVTGVYAMLAGDNGYGNRISCLYPQTADDFKTSGSYSPLDRRGISMYGASPLNSELVNPFRQLYQGIERANVCIKYIPLSPVYASGNAADQATMHRLYGEALTLRAQFYYELVRNWGDIPFHKVPAADLTDVYLPRTDRDTIYDQLLKDLKIAEDIVPWRSEGVGGLRVTKGFVKGLRARIALARGGYSLRSADSKYGQVMARPDDYKAFYQIARDECYDVMQRPQDHDLNPSYENVFRALNGLITDDTHETIFEVGAFGANASTDSKLGYYNGVNFDANSVYGRGGGGVICIPTYFYEFDSIGDCRRDITISSIHIDKNSQKSLNTLNAMTDGKYNRAWTNVIGGTSQNFGIDWPILRFSDILLMFAEADNELNNGPSADAINALKRVRDRAYTGHLDRESAIPTDKSGFFNAIVHERLLEFGGEGVRKYDLIRWNLISSTFDKVRSNWEDLLNGTGRYANVPLFIFNKPNNYDPKNNVTNEENSLDLGSGNSPANIFFRPVDPNATTPAGYTKIAWRSSIRQVDIDGGDTGFAYYFSPNSRELFPIPQDILNENYKLHQEYGY